MPIYHVSLTFSQLPDAALVDFGSQVITGLDGNPAFPTPAVPIIELQSKQGDFQGALNNMLNGGKQATAAKNIAREVFINLLRQEANYVQLKGNNDLPTILSSGYEVASVNRTRTQLDTPTIVGLENGLTTQLVARVKAVANARSYEAQVKNGVGGWIPAGVFTSTRQIVLGGLTPGQTYSVQVRAVGGSTGYSGWSDPVSHMVM